MTTMTAPALPALTAEVAGQIRATAWTPAMRKSYRETPGWYHRCACQSGLTHWCRTGQHDRCHRAAPLRSYAAVICGPDGETPALFAEPYAHDTDVYATGPRRTSLAMVWLADRVCAWQCPCDCGHRPARPRPRPRPARPARTSQPTQPTLF